MKHQSNSEVLLCQTDDGTAGVEVGMAGEIAWLNHSVTLLYGKMSA